MVQLQRREFGTQPGESLLTARHPHHPEDLVVTRPTAWQNATGLTVRDDLLTTNLLTVPLPIYREQVQPPPAPGAYDSRRDFPTVPASMMWHPLLWLPERVASRFAFTEDVIENDQEWAMRVALEVTETGMYEEATGTWMDVLSLVGLDADDPVDQARVEYWQAGEPDDALDDLHAQMEQIYDSVDPDWAVAQTAQAIHLVQQATWGRIADDLLRDFEYLEDPDPTWTHEEVGTEVRLLTALAPILLADAADPYSDDGAPMGPLFDEVDGQLRATDPTDLHGLLAGPAATARELLVRVHQVYYPVLTDQFLKLGEVAEELAGTSPQ